MTPSMNRRSAREPFSASRAPAAYQGTGSGDRTAALACCGVALATLVPVALRQFNLIDHLSDPPGRFFNSDGIVTSASARPFGIPDAVLGFASYGTTLALLLAARPSRPIARVALRAKLALDATVAAHKARGQVKEFHQVCSWCLGTAAATAAVVFFARRSLRQAKGFRMHHSDS